MLEYEIVITYTLLAALTNGSQSETFTVSVMPSSGIDSVLSKGYFKVPQETGVFKLVPFSSVASSKVTLVS